MGTDMAKKQSGTKMPKRRNGLRLQRSQLYKREDYLFVIVSIAIALVTFFFWYRGAFETYDFNKATLAFTYRYGFICRALIGTCLETMAKFLNVELSAKLIDQFSVLLIVFLITGIILFLDRAGSRTSELSGDFAAKCVYLVGLIFEIGVGFSTFYVDWGRTDIFLLVFSLLICWLLVIQRGTWGIILIVAVCMMIHEGFIFMYSGIVFVMFVYRLVCSIEKKDRRKIIKYGVEMLFSLCTAIALFIYFYFYARPNKSITYEQVLEYSKNIVGNPTEDFINVVYAIDGQLFGNRWTYFGQEEIIQNIRCLPAALIAFSPFIILFIAYWNIAWHELGKGQYTKLQRIFYRLIPFGTVTTLPLFFTHMDYWRWYYQICFYEIFIVIGLIAAGDRLLTETLQKVVRVVSNTCYLPVFLITYAAVLGPFRNQGFYMCDYYIASIRELFRLF